MRHIWRAVGLLGLGWLVLAALLNVRAESAGDPQSATMRLPACYADVFKTAHTKLTAVYGTTEQDAADNHISAFSADGKLALSTSGGNVMGDQVEDSILTLWEVQSGKSLRQIFVKNGCVYALQMTPEGNRAFGALWFMEQGEEVIFLVVWDLKKGKELKRWSAPGGSYSLVLTPDGKRGLTYGGKEGLVNIWDLETGKNLQNFSAYPNGLTVSRDGKLVAYSMSFDMENPRIELWDLTTGKKVRSWKVKVETDAIKFSEDGKQLAAVIGQTVKIWDTKTGQVIAALVDKLADKEDLFSGPIMLAFSKDGKRLALVNYHLDFDNLGRINYKQANHSVALWELQGAKKLWSKPLARNASFLTFTPDKQEVLVCGAGKSFVRLDAANGKELRGRGGDHFGPIQGVATSPGGKFLYTASADRTIKRWNAVTGMEEKTFQPHAKGVTCLALSADGKQLLSGSADRTVNLWDATSGKLCRTFTGHTERVTGVAFSQDGKLALSGGMDRTARLWDATTGQELRLLEGHAHGVTGVALRSDGSLAITASADRTLKIWDLAAMAGDRKPRDLKGHQGAVLCLTLSADGRYLLTGSQDQTVKLWDVNTGRELKTFRGHKNWVTSVAFSPNGKLGASVSDDLTVQLWDLTSGQRIDQLDLGQCGDCGRCVTFTPDGRSVLVGTANWVVLRLELTGRTGK